MTLINIIGLLFWVAIIWGGWKIFKMEGKKQVGKDWEGEFGKSYTQRNIYTAYQIDKEYYKSYGITRTDLNDSFLGNMYRTIKILEVGSNIGTQLLVLQEMGFKNLYGIEINSYAVELSKKKTKNINIIQGSVFDIPFKDNYFDIVFTSGVLIHINPNDMQKTMREIHRCSGQYIWGCEYFSEEYQEILYRGKKDLLWKANFQKIYLESFADLKLVKEKKLQYLDNQNIDIMFLIKK